MKVSIKEVEGPELKVGVDRLRTRVYAHFPEAYDTAWHDTVWDWLRTHPLSGDMHRWAAVSGDEVVGHLAAVPQYYRINGQRVVAHTPTDYQALPGYGFHALSLMRTFFRTTENCVACDMVPEVIGVEKRLGAEVAGNLQYAAKLLDVSQLPAPRLLDRRQETDAPRAETPEIQGPAAVEPPPARPRAPIPRPVKRLLNGGLQAVDEALGALSDKHLEVEPVTVFGEEFDRLFEKVAAAVSCIPEKDAAFLHWRYGPGSPQYPLTVLGVRGSQAEGLLGYTILRVTREGSNGLQDGFILDLTTLPGRRDVARALLRESVRFFRRAGIPLIRYRFLTSTATPQPADLLRLGFFSRNERSNTLLAKFADKSLHDEASDTANWSYTIGDGEATFWIR